MADNPSLTIVSFHKQYLEDPKPVSTNKSADYSINFILYTPSDKLHLTEQSIMQSMSNRQDCSLTKCHSALALNQELISPTKSLKTMVILDEIDEEVINMFIKHHKSINDEIGHICIALLVDSVSAVHYRFFHQEHVDVITSDERKISEFIEDMIKKTSAFGSFIQNSSLNSDDLQGGEKIFDLRDQVREKIPDQQNRIEEKQTFVPITYYGVNSKKM